MPISRLADRSARAILSRGGCTLPGAQIAMEPTVRLRSRPHGSTRWLILGCGLFAAFALPACSPTKLAVRPVRYEVDVRLDPAGHTVDGRATVELERVDTDQAANPSKRAAIDLLLHPDLLTESVETEGATLRAHKTKRKKTGEEDEEGAVVPIRHRLIVEGAADEIVVSFDYRGRLHQDVTEGEEEGRIHNFSISAHAGEEGVFLNRDGYWYPIVELPEEADPDLSLADYTLTADPIEGFELVAGLERVDDGPQGRIRWRSAFPLNGMVLLGGPLTRWTRRHGDIELHAVLAPDKEGIAQDILDAAAEYLDRYEPLIGPYPFKEFTVLEAFFSSGFAFPGSTQITGILLNERGQYRRHGYLDHELLHNWWGNGILVDPRDGNWCEALASYMGNYYGHVLDDDEQAARKQRRNQSNFLSSIKSEDDKPLGTFQLADGAGRDVGYTKGAAVFHMIERKIGAEAMQAALRRLTDERMGRYTNWDHLREALEVESGTDLEQLFEQWVRRGGAPLLELTDAEWTRGSERLKLSISQGETDFVLDVPLRLQYGDRSEDVVVTVDAPSDEVIVPCEPEGLTAVELDPDYHVFRKLKPTEAMPTSSLTRRGRELLVIVPDGELDEPYQHVVESWKRAVLGDEDEPRKGHHVEIRRAGEVSAEDLGGPSVLVVGDAVRHTTVEKFLGRTRSPVRWIASGFRIDGAEYTAPGQAVFLTVHHPDEPESGVTVYYGNSTEALGNSRLLTYYANSLLVFDTPPAEDPGGAPHGMPHSKVVRRMDFEFHGRIEF
jgi:hypothetical protein